MILCCLVVVINDYDNDDDFAKQQTFRHCRYVDVLLTKLTFLSFSDVWSMV